MLEVVEVRLMKMSMKEDSVFPTTRIGVKEEGGEWSLEQEKSFELALAKEEREEEEDDDDNEREREREREREGEGGDGKSCQKWKWYERVAAMVPGKDASQVEKHYLDLVTDVKCIEEGWIRLPNYRDLPESGADSLPPATARSLGKDGASFRKPPPPGGGGGGFHPDPERRKGIPWTEEEHRLFLEGLDKFGKGDWRSISRNFVVSRTPTQVASHAQKYFIRLNSMSKEKRRTSIHDITTTSTNGARELGQESSPTSLLQPPHPIFTTPRPTQYAMPPPLSSTPTLGHPINTNPNGHAPFVSYVPTVTMPMPHPATYY